ncbi:MAG: hypothetical protein AAFR27_10570 [Pseudomonadota bacterium]
MHAYFLPNPVEFRQWADKVLFITGITAGQWSMSAGYSSNMLGKLLSQESPNPKLKTAHDLVVDIVNSSRERGILLPPLNPAADLTPEANDSAQVDVSVAVNRTLKVLAEREGVTVRTLVEQLTHDYAESTGTGFVLRALEAESTRSEEVA